MLTHAQMFHYLSQVGFQREKSLFSQLFLYQQIK